MLKKVLKRYFIDAMGSMAYGLFASLIIGTIIGQIGALSGWEMLDSVATVLKDSRVYGAAIGAAIALGLKADPLVVFSAAGAGAIGCVAGGPVGAYLGGVIGAEIGQLVSKKTPADIVITPLVTVLSGGVVCLLAGTYIQQFMVWLGELVNMAVELMPLPMGMVVGAAVGMILTLPISSAAICVAISISGLAAGAATAGCAAQMVGFAVISYKENRFSGLLSQGIGTSMLQIPNIFTHPQIWIAPTVASAVSGALSAAVFKMVSTSIGAGMGTSGLVGPIATYGAMTEAGFSSLETLGLIVLVHIVVPAVVALAVHKLLRKSGFVKDEYLRLKKV